MSLSKQTIRDAEYVLDCASGQKVFHVYDPHALVQAAGYLKFKNSMELDENVFFRGETKLHGSLSPTLFRGLTTQGAQSRKIQLLNESISKFKKENKIFTDLPDITHEALLQHYGLKTTWLDLVDNVWIALWFACHKAHSTGKYLHFEKRSVHKEMESRRFVYILLVAADNGAASRHSAGIYIGKNTELIDLRVAVPSIFLRPHSQHGLLFRVRGDNVMRPLDYKSQIRGILRITLDDGLAWLGDGQMLGVHALFPPPYYDRGYEILLGSGFNHSEIGCIAHVGA